MRVIPPLTITDAILTSSSQAEPALDEVVYSGSTTYAAGAQVISTSTHKIYESISAGNIGNPLPVAPETATAFWFLVGPTNKWRMFDLLRNTQTTTASPLTIVLTPGVRVNSIALLGLDANEVNITVKTLDMEVYNVTVDLDSRTVENWWEYFFEPFSTKSSVVYFDLPMYTNAVITVTITKISGNVSCGGLVIGSYAYLGDTQISAESDALNYSTVERNSFGDSILVPRRTIPKTNQTLKTDKSLVDNLMRVRAALNAAPAVWSGLDDQANDYFEALLILGYYRRFTINMQEHLHATITLELEEI